MSLRAEELVLIGVFLAGAFLLYLKSANWDFLSWWPVAFHEFAPALGEALVVASILALVVDRFAKKRLLQEASRSIFEHMIGYDHEPLIRQEIRRIALSTNLYQKDYKLTCIVEPLSEGRVKLSLSKEIEVFNESLDVVPFRPGWRFTEADSPSDCRIEIIDGLEPKEIPLGFETDNAGYHSSLAPEIKIRPERENNRYRFVAKCSIVQPADWYHAVYFGLPTIDALITVNAPAGWTVWVGAEGHWQEPQLGTALFHKRGLSMTGDKIEIHWRKPQVA